MLRDLAAELSRSEERERRRIAVLLHDKVGQALALMQMKLELAQGQSAADRALIGEALSLLEQTVTDTRSLTCALSPPVLYELGLDRGDGVAGGTGAAGARAGDRTPCRGRAQIVGP